MDEVVLTFKTPDVTMQIEHLSEEDQKFVKSFLQNDESISIRFDLIFGTAEVVHG
jgi:hypothetical protein